MTIDPKLDELLQRLEELDGEKAALAAEADACKRGFDERFAAISLEREALVPKALELVKGALPAQDQWGNVEFIHDGRLVHCHDSDTCRYVEFHHHPVLDKPR